MLNIDLNFENIYELHVNTTNLKSFSFSSPTINGDNVHIEVWIQDAENLFLQDFLNLCYGPVADGTMNDFASVPHLDHSKALSTVLFCALTYLETQPDKYIGVDGSDFRRAYLYYRTIQRNYDYLRDYFRLFGVKYYARILRGSDKNDNMTVDISELYSVPYKIEQQPLNNHKSLYNYFIMYLA